MYKSLLLTIFSLLFITSCSFKNPLNKNSQVVYVDCPKTLILAPASKIIEDVVTLNLNKNYSMNCYTSSQTPTEIILEFNFLVDASFIKANNTSNDFEFVVFVTNKQEDQKLFEQFFPNTIITEIKSDKIDSSFAKKSEFIEKIKIEKVIFDKGIKVFIGII